MDLLLLIVPLILGIAASINVKSTYKKYAKVPNGRGLTGEAVARQILDANGLYHVGVEHVSGSLTDHFDPRSNVVRLSDAVFGETSVAALGVAAHECGHALQHQEGYAPIQFRSALVPVTNFCSRAWYFIFLLGLFFSETAIGLHLINIAILLFAGVALFQLVTLPVEFNASSRALQILESGGYLYGGEVGGAKAVLRAAALTYVASVLSSLAQLLRLILISRRRK